MKARSTMVIKRRLSRKKVLIVLDDVDSSEQLDYLVGEQPYLGAGSRVIITSRDKHIFVSKRIGAIHEVKELSFEESLKLFSFNAFNQSHPKTGYEELSKRVVDYANGIPLALKVLGLDLRSRSIETWESTLKKLEKYPNVEIQNVLKVSYDELDCAQKDIFLDIAFFFKGEFKDDVIRLLNGFGFYGANGIDSLLDKALITLSSDNKIQMHDLIREMGEQIVREESIKDPGKRSQLNDAEEVYDVLKNNKGTDAIEVIILDVSKIREVHLNSYTFKKMTNLRFLQFYNSHGWYRKSYNVNLPSSLESFCDKLRYFQWDGYPLESLPSTFLADKLFKLCMRHSQVTKLWDGVQELVNLREIDLSGSEQLIELPDFSKAQNLQSVNLYMCGSLCNVHSSILSLHSLDTLNLHLCKKLKSLKSDTHLKSLRELNVCDCSSLKELSLSGKEIESLYLEGVAIEILYPSIGRLSKLKVLIIHGETLKNLPMEICHLKSLRRLHLHNYEQVIEKWKLHILFDALHSLNELSLHGCSKLSELPDNIKYSRLDYFILSECKRLRYLPELPQSINYLEAFDCTSLETVFPLKICISELCSVGTNFLFLNCVKLDEDSLWGSMEFSLFLMKARFNYDCRADNVCYPGSRVPKWFIYKQMTGASITIDIGPAFDHLLGFVFCSVVSQFALKEYEEWYIYFDCYFEDGEEAYWGKKYCFDRELKLDHVILWDEYRFAWKSMIKRFRKRRGNDDGTTYNTKLLFQFSITSDDGVGARVEHDGLIKACGVYPIYAVSKLE